MRLYGDLPLSAVLVHVNTACSFLVLVRQRLLPRNLVFGLLVPVRDEAVQEAAGFAFGVPVIRFGLIDLCNG